MSSPIFLPIYTPAKKHVILKSKRSRLMMKISCQCGKLRGEIERPEELRGLRIVCMCKDCQRFARALGNSKNILDENGGLEVVPVFPKLLRITSGQEYLKCLKNTPQSGTFRWYASCCKSPLANSLSGKEGYIGLVTQCLSEEDKASLGPVRARANGESGIPPLPKGTSKKFPLKWIFIMIYLIVRGQIQGWKQPNPFFDQNNHPLFEPEIIIAPKTSKADNY